MLSSTPSSVYLQQDLSLVPDLLLSYKIQSPPGPLTVTQILDLLAKASVTELTEKGN